MASREDKEVHRNKRRERNMKGKEKKEEKKEDAFVNDKTSTKDRRELYLYLNLVIRIIQLFGALKLVPLAWNQKRRRIEMTDSQLNYVIWIFCVEATTVVFLYGTWRLIKEIFDPTPNFQGYKIILYLFYYLNVSAVLAYNYTLIFKQRMAVQLFNTYINAEFALTDILAKNGYKFDKEGMREYQKFRTYLVMITVVVVAMNILLTVQSALADTDLDPMHRFLLEHFPPDFEKSPWVVLYMSSWMFILILHICGTVFIGCMACMVFTMRINHYITFILLEDQNRLLLRDARSAVKMHIYLDYICKSINAWTSFMTPVVLFLGNLIHTMFMYAAVRFYGVVPMPGYLYFPIASINMAAFELLILPKGGEIYDRSSMARNVWAQQPMEKSLSKQIRTMAPFGLSAQFFWIKKDTAVTFLQTAVNNTIDMVLAIKT